MRAHQARSQIRLDLLARIRDLMRAHQARSNQARSINKDQGFDACTSG